MWEKKNEFTLPRTSGSLNTKEVRYRRILNLAKKKCTLPPMNPSLQLFEFRVFVHLHVRRKEADILWKHFKLVKDLTLRKQSVGAKEIDTVMYAFWQAQRIMSPAAPPPVSKTVDSLSKLLEANKALFENAEGIKIQTR